LACLIFSIHCLHMPDIGCFDSSQVAMFGAFYITTPAHLDIKWAGTNYN
jgi:hypothetical protein